MQLKLEKTGERFFKRQQYNELVLSFYIVIIFASNIDRKESLFPVMFLVLFSFGIYKFFCMLKK